MKGTKMFWLKPISYNSFFNGINAIAIHKSQDIGMPEVRFFHRIMTSSGL